MVKGGIRHSSMSKDGKWFAHLGSPESETRSRETCTSTGIMLNQVKATLPQALNSEYYPKWKTQQKSREYPLSCHDNKYSLKDNISVFTEGVGRRKCPDDLRENSSHLCLCQGGADGGTEGTRSDLSVYQSDFPVTAAVSVPNRTRRFPHDHRQRSEQAASDPAREQFMWFGRDNLGISETPEVSPATKFPAPSKP